MSVSCLFFSYFPLLSLLSRTFLFFSLSSFSSSSLALPNRERLSLVSSALSLPLVASIPFPRPGSFDGLRCQLPTCLGCLYFFFFLLTNDRLLKVTNNRIVYTFFRSESPVLLHTTLQWPKTRSPITIRSRWTSWIKETVAPSRHLPRLSRELLLQPTTRSCRCWPTADLRF